MTSVEDTREEKETLDNSTAEGHVDTDLNEERKVQGPK